MPKISKSQKSQKSPKSQKKQSLWEFSIFEIAIKIVFEEIRPYKHNITFTLFHSTPEKSIFELFWPFLSFRIFSIFQSFTSPKKCENSQKCQNHKYLPKMSLVSNFEVPRPKNGFKRAPNSFLGVFPAFSRVWGAQEAKSGPNPKFSLLIAKMDVDPTWIQISCP